MKLMWDGVSCFFLYTSTIFWIMWALDAAASNSTQGKTRKILHLLDLKWFSFFFSCYLNLNKKKIFLSIITCMKHFWSNFDSCVVLVCLCVTTTVVYILHTIWFWEIQEKICSILIWILFLFLSSSLLIFFHLVSKLVRHRIE